jgi:hypothetical protein
MAIPKSVGQSAPAANYAHLMTPEGPEGDAARTLHMAVTAPFLLRHHPLHWSAESDGLEATTWLPDISILPLVAGAHLVRTRKANEAASESIKLAVNADANNGWTHLDPATVIPAECLPTGVPVGGYRRPMPTQDPVKGEVGTVYLEAWAVPKQWVPGTGRQKYAYDRPSYNRWRLWLVTEGILAPPTEDVLLSIQQSRGVRVDRILARNPAEDMRAKKKADEERKLAAAMESAAVPDISEDARPAPKSTRKGAVKV